MKAIQFWVWLLTVLVSTTTHANNGKVAFAYPVEGVVIDGNFEDWDQGQMTSLLEGLPNNISKNDVDAKFQVGYNTKEKALYFIVEITDDSYAFDESKPWFLNDNLVLYFNPLHSERAATASMLILNELGIQLLQPDISHQLLNETNIVWKSTQKGTTSYYEGKVLFADGIQEMKSIGFDVLVVDADFEGNNKYVNWGKGQEKHYRSGQLGDVVLLRKNDIEFGTVSGSIEWEHNIIDPLPNVIKVKSKEYPALWVTTEVDSTGRFSLDLPIGAYYVQSAYKIASPYADHGDQNQSRIDDSFKMNVIIESTTNIDIGTFKIPTYKVPRYLNETEGVLHNFDGDKAGEMDNFITSICSYYNIPGASVAIIKDGRVVYYNHFGVENLLTQNPVKQATLFQAASVTKSVFAFIVLRLVEKGQLDLDRPLYQYLSFPNVEHIEDFKLLTARMVLSHQSGLPNWAWGGPGGYASGQKTDLLFTPGTKYGYSGEGFAYLGRVVEKVTGKDLNELLKDEVIDPLDIPEMYFMDNGKITQARGHYADGLPTYYGLPYEPGVAHTLLSEAFAFAQFVVALCNRKGLSEETYDSLEQRLAHTSNFDSPDNLYWNVGTSLGFFVQDTPFGKAIMHGGNNGNFQAEFVLYTEKKMGFVVFANSNTGHKLAQELGRHLMYGNN